MASLIPRVTISQSAPIPLALRANSELRERRGVEEGREVVAVGGVEEGGEVVAVGGVDVTGVSSSTFKCGTIFTTAALYPSSPPCW